MERRLCRPGSFNGKEFSALIVEVSRAAAGAGATSSLRGILGVPSTRNRSCVTRRMDLKTRQSET